MYVDEQDNLPTPEVVTSTSSMNVNASMDPVHILMMKNRQPVEEKLRYVEKNSPDVTTKKEFFLLPLSTAGRGGTSRQRDYGGIENFRR